MCKRKSHLIDQSTMVTEGGYEGQTVRLDSRDGISHERREHRYGGFPWWTLWLLWPLIGLAKWFVPLYLGVVTAGLTQLSTAGGGSLVAIALIVIGLVLIARR